MTTKKLGGKLEGWIVNKLNKTLEIKTLCKILNIITIAYTLFVGVGIGVMLSVSAPAYIGLFGRVILFVGWVIGVIIISIISRELCYTPEQKKFML